MSRAPALLLTLALALPAACDLGDNPNVAPETSVDDVDAALVRAETYPADDLEGFGVVVDHVRALVDRATEASVIGVPGVEARLDALEERLREARAATTAPRPRLQAVRLPFPSGDGIAAGPGPACLGKNEPGERFGGALAFGDFDGDGYDDLAVGNPSESTRFDDSVGRVYVYRGGPTGYTPWFSLGQDGLGTQESGDKFGSSLAAGDFDGDGAVDLAVGVPNESIGNIQRTGYVYLFRGGVDGLSPWSGLGQDQGATEADDRFGHALAAGDFNGDGIADLAVSAEGEDTLGAVATGFVYVFRGTATGLTAWHGLHHDGLAPAEDGESFGWALSVGDFNGDGRDDLVVGAKFGNQGSGAVWIFMARPLVTGINVYWSSLLRPYKLAVSQKLDQGGIGSNEYMDRFGEVLASGDFDGDGDDDLAVGAPGEDSHGREDNGLGFVFRSQGSLLVPWHTVGPDAMDTALTASEFASSMVAGDFNGDGRDDLAIGRRRGAKRLFLWRGWGTGLQPWGTLAQVTYADDSDDAFAETIAVGDVDGDGRADLAVAAPREDVGSVSAAGVVSVFAGRSGTLLPQELGVVAQESPGCSPTWPAAPSIALSSSAHDRLVVRFSGANAVSHLETYASGSIGARQIDATNQITRTFAGLAGATTYCFYAAALSPTSSDWSNTASACFATPPSPAPDPSPDPDPDPAQPVEHTYSTKLVPGATVSGHRPYEASWGPVYGARMLRFQIHKTFLDNYIMHFLKPGYAYASCSNPAAVVTLAAGATATPEQITAIFGTAEPRGRVEFRACKVGNTTFHVPLTITYVYDDGH